MMMKTVELDEAQATLGELIAGLKLDDDQHEEMLRWKGKFDAGKATKDSEQ